MNFLIFIILLTFPLFLHTSQSFLTHFNNSTDQNALLFFKSSVTNDPNGILLSWNPNTSFCQWHGVLCNPIKQRVIALSLADSSLSGTISSHITNLSFLQTLDLYNNSFSGEIPVNFHHLFRLKLLDLSYNNLHGFVPSSLRNCLNLYAIDLSNNKFHGTIPFELGYLWKLQYLNLAKNNLSGLIPCSLGNLSSLSILSVTSNNIVGSIPVELGRLRKLQSLQLGINNISGSFPIQLFNLSSLLRLNIAINKISDRFPSEFFAAFPYLTRVLMAGNMLHGRIPSSLSNASSLEVIDLSAIPLVWKLGKLQYFNLEENNLTSEGRDGLDFITSLTNATLLQTFSVSRNRLTGQLPSSIGNLSNQLFQFYMGANQLDGAIPQEIGNLVGLTMIQLESNSFTEKIPSSIRNLKNLQSLLLSNNFLSGPIPEELGNLSQLFSLGLEGNNFNGVIPSTLSNCNRLNYVDLTGNGFIGNLPKEIFTSLNSLDFIDISSNKLNGSLPSEVGNLKMLRYLGVSDNRLSGEIPSSIGDCSNLIYIFMSDNSFQGPIPRTIANLRGIEYIDLSSNTLSGKIPSLDSLPYLQYLNLSANKLQGEVPKSGIFLNTSAVFLSENTELCGGIAQLGLPKCVSSNNHPAKRKLYKKLTAGIIVGIIVVGIVIISVSYYLISYTKRKKQPGSKRGEEEMISFEGPHKLFSYHELKSATGNFGDENLIGKGSFGSVFKGLMSDGTLAAIKVLNLDQRGALKSFLAECEAFRNIRHRNLVKILSVCSGQDFKALVLEFMTNGNLENWVHRKREDGSRNGLSLKERIDIAIDVASAMEYLHHECETPIVHCDLKPSNVLLDENMVAHVGDFGLARMLQNHGNLFNQQESSTIGLKGSIGYIPPEYGFGARVSTKGDVYSYGILLLEIFTEKKPTDEMFRKELNMQRWVAATLPNIVMEIFNEELKESYDIQITNHLISIIRLGLRCASEAPEERPEMKEVVVSIKKAQLLVSKQVFIPMSRSIKTNLGFR